MNTRENSADNAGARRCDCRRLSRGWRPSMSNRYRRERRPDGVLLIDTLEHRSVLIVWDQVGDQGDGFQKDWLWHYSRDLPPEPQPRTDLCRYPHVLQAGACCERSPCKYHEG